MSDFGQFELGKALINALDERKKAVRMGIESVLVDMTNFAKQNAPFKDHTSNLRNSISHSNAEIQPDGSIVGTVYAGMEYAPYVEHHPDLWVLSGSMNEFQGKIVEEVTKRAGLR